MIILFTLHTIIRIFFNLMDYFFLVFMIGNITKL